jgi:hypothetical protein
LIGKDPLGQRQGWIPESRMHWPWIRAGTLPLIQEKGEFGLMRDMMLREFTSESLHFLCTNLKQNFEQRK